MILRDGRLSIARSDGWPRRLVLMGSRLLEFSLQAAAGKLKLKLQHRDFGCAASAGDPRIV
jgi:hypothetical protein